GRVWRRRGCRCGCRSWRNGSQQIAEKLHLVDENVAATRYDVRRARINRIDCRPRRRAECELDLAMRLQFDVTRPSRSIIGVAPIGHPPTSIVDYAEPMLVRAKFLWIGHHKHQVDIRIAPRRFPRPGPHEGKTVNVRSRTRPRCHRSKDLLELRAVSHQETHISN